MLIKLWKGKYFIEPLTVGILIVIFIYLPDRVKIFLRGILIKLQPTSVINTQNCLQIPVIKYIHPIKGELWIIEDSECLTLTKNDMIVYDKRLIGKVIDKKENYSIILPIYNKNVKLKVKVKTKNNVIVKGIFQGMGSNKGMVFFVPASFDIQDKEMVYTVLDEKNKIYENLLVGFVQQQLIERDQTVTLIVSMEFNFDVLSKDKVTIFSF